MTRDCRSFNSLFFFPSKNIENGVFPYSVIFLGVFRNCTDELVSTRGGWRRFPGGIGPGRKNMKKAVPQLTLITFFISVLEESIFSVFLLQYISPGKRATKSSFVLFTFNCFDQFFCKHW